MSLNSESFGIAWNARTNFNNRINELFKQLNLPLKDKVQMDHYGGLYLFGVRVSSSYTDSELKQIIESTPEESWNNHIEEFGWYGYFNDNDCELNSVQDILKL